MTNDELAMTLAEIFEGAARTLLSRLARSPDGEVDDAGGRLVDAVTRARSIHPALGPRQAQVLEFLDQCGRDGSHTSVIADAVGITQPNAHLTLKTLVTLGFVEKDDLTWPKTYRLAGELMPAEV